MSRNEKQRVRLANVGDSDEVMMQEPEAGDEYDGLASLFEDEDDQAYSLKSSGGAGPTSSKPTQGLGGLDSAFLLQFMSPKASVSAQTASAPAVVARGPSRAKAGEKREISLAGQAAEARASGAAKKGRIERAGPAASAGPVARDQVAGGRSRQGPALDFDALHENMLAIHVANHRIRESMYSTEDSPHGSEIRIPEGVQETWFMKFLCNKGKTRLEKGDVPDFLEAYNFCDFLGMNDNLFEKKHNFIAFTIPTDQQSDYCAQAPLLTKPEVRAIMQNAVLMHRCRAVVGRALQHFGIVYNQYDVQFEVVKGRTLDRLKHQNHNQLRLSRVLRFLRILSPEHAIALLQFVSSKTRTSKRDSELEVEGQLSNNMIIVSEYTYDRWHNSVFRPSLLSF